MSTLSGGPNTAIDGLVLYLDAANSKSYMSGSSTWIDLSRRTNNATLINGPAYDSANGGSIVFDGVDEYTTTQPGSIIFTPTNSFTLNVIFRLSSITPNLSVASTTTSIFGNGATANSVGIGALLNNSTNSYHLYVGSRAIDQLAYILDIELNVPYNVTFVYDGNSQLNITPNQYTYVNGILKDTRDVSSGLGGSFETNSFGWASFINRAVPGGNAAAGGGVIHQCSIYNRALSATEILQNFNATKTRFGL
jgi:hypothetical protein